MSPSDEGSCTMYLSLGERPVWIPGHRDQGTALGDLCLAPPDRLLIEGGPSIVPMGGGDVCRCRADPILGGLSWVLAGSIGCSQAGERAPSPSDILPPARHAPPAGAGARKLGPRRRRVRMERFPQLFMDIDRGVETDRARLSGA